MLYNWMWRRGTGWNVPLPLQPAQASFSNFPLSRWFQLGFFIHSFWVGCFAPLSLWASKEWITVAGCPCPCHFTSSLLPLLFILPIPASCISHSLYVSLALFVCLALIAILSRWYRIQFHKFIVLVKKKKNVPPYLQMWMNGGSIPLKKKKKKKKESFINVSSTIFFLFPLLSEIIITNHLKKKKKNICSVPPSVDEGREDAIKKKKKKKRTLHINLALHRSAVHCGMPDL